MTKQSRRRKAQIRQQSGDVQQQKSNKQQKPAKKMTTVVNTEHGTETQAQKSKRNDAPANEKQSPKTQRGLCKWRNWLKVFVIVEIALAAAIAWFAWVQADVGKGQLDAMKDQNATLIEQNWTILWQSQLAYLATEQTDAVLEQMRLEQRPWIGIESTTMGEFTDNSINGTLTMKNSGDSPAFIYASRFMIVGFQIQDKDLAELTEVDSSQPKGEPLQQVVPPGQEIIIPISSGPLLPGWGKETEEGKRPAYVIGAIFYKDAAGSRHVTGVCMIYDAKAKYLRQFEKYNYMK